MRKINSRIFLLSILVLGSYLACQKQNGQTLTDEPLNSKNINTAQKSATTEPELTGKNSDPPLLINKVSVYSTKPPRKMYWFEMEFKSRRENYKWLIMQNSLGEPLAENGIFHSWEDGEFPIDAEKFFESKEHVVLIDFYGDESFRAIRLPEKGSIKFNPLVFFGAAGATEIEVWEVRSLLVNGKTPLENWLPFDTASTQTTVPINSRRRENRDDLTYNKKTDSERTDYPKEGIKFITAEGVRKWRIPFKITPN